jgi:hypothetical protein
MVATEEQSSFRISPIQQAARGRKLDRNRSGLLVMLGIGRTETQ